MAETNVINSQIQSEILQNLSGESCDVSKFVPSIEVKCPPVFSNRLTVNPDERSNPGTLLNPKVLDTLQTSGPTMNVAPTNTLKSTGGVYTFSVPQQGHLHRAVLKLNVDVSAFNTTNTEASTMLTNKFGAYAAVDTVELLCNGAVIEKMFGRQMFAEMISSSTASQIESNLALAKWRNVSNGVTQPTTVFNSFNSEPLNSTISTYSLQCYLNLRFSCFKSLRSNLNARVLNTLKIRVTLRQTYCSFRTGYSHTPQAALCPDNYTTWGVFSRVTDTVDGVVGNARANYTGIAYVTGSNLAHTAPLASSLGSYTYDIKTWSGTVLVPTTTVPAIVGAAEILRPLRSSDTRVAYRSTNASTVDNFRPTMLMYFNMYSSLSEKEMYAATYNDGVAETATTSCFSETPVPLVYSNTVIIPGSKDVKVPSNDGQNPPVRSGAALFKYTPFCASYCTVDAVFSNSAVLDLECRNLAESILCMCDTDDFPLHFMASINSTTLSTQNMEIYSSNSSIENAIDSTNKRMLDNGESFDALPGMNWFVGRDLLNNASAYTLSASNGAGEPSTAAYLASVNEWTKIKQIVPQTYGHIFFNKSSENGAIGGSLGLKTLVAPRLNVSIISNEYGSNLTPDYQVFTYVKYHQLLQTNANTGNVSVIACT